MSVTTSTVTGALAVGAITSLAYGQGSLLVGGALGLATLHFSGDFLRVRTSTTVKRQERIATAGVNALQAEPGNASMIVNSAVNAVAMTVLPDAPFDVVTGLQVPTIAVATGGG